MTGVPGGDERLSLLLIADAAGDVQLVSELLRQVRAPIDVAVAASVGEARQQLNDVDCVLLDLALPDTHGLDGLRTLLKLARRAAVCVLTGLFDEHLGVAALAEGAQDYLIKSQLNGVSLYRALRYAVERKRADDHNRQLREADLGQAESARLERGLLPQPLMDTDLVAVRSFYRTGRQRGLIGGDFYDVVQSGPDRIHFMVGDVCGHSVEEAALGVGLRVAWRALVLGGVPDDAVLPALEQVLMSERRAPELFATVATLSLELSTGQATLRLAGHPPPLLVHGQHAAPLPAATNRLLGVVPKTPEPYEFLLSPGEALLLYTDGLIEGRSGADRLDIDGLCALIAEPESATVGFSALPAWLVGRAERANGGPLADDVAMLMVSRVVPA